MGMHVLKGIPSSTPCLQRSRHSDGEESLGARSRAAEHDAKMRATRVKLRGMLIMVFRVAVLEKSKVEMHYLI
jgi:hypothetical protein